MRFANWVPYIEPSPEIRKGMVHLCEHVVANEDDIQGSVNYYIHPEMNLAMCQNIRGEWLLADLGQESQ